MNYSPPYALIECDGILCEILPGLFQHELPALMSQYRQEAISLIVTTRLNRFASEMRRKSIFFQAARNGQPPEFTWKATGPLNLIVRQFRLDFLRHLSDDELKQPVRLVAYIDNGDASADEDHDAPDDFPETDVSHELAKYPSDPNEDTMDLSLEVQPEPSNGHSSAGLADAIGIHQPPPGVTAANVAAETPMDVKRRGPLSGQGFKSLLGNLYQDFFSFEMMPFNNTPDSHFYFPSEKHQEALSRLIYAISEHKGFVMISGEIGSGKSTLCRTLLAQLPSEVKTALVTHTHLDAFQLLKAIAEDLGIDATGMDRLTILQRLYDFLIEQMSQGCTVCIIIDEAQNLSPEALEEVRMISNLETEQDKLVQLILMGQPELRDKVNLPELKQLRQRIAVQYHIHALDQRETVQYIQHRLKVANPAQPLDFKRNAMAEVYRYSGGVPRLINTICDNALLTAFTKQTLVITRKLIREAGNDLDLQPLPGGLGGLFGLW